MERRWAHISVKTRYCSLAIPLCLLSAMMTGCGFQQKIAPQNERPRSSTSQHILGKDGAPMVLISAGGFQIGSEYGHASGPAHTAHVDAFYIDIYEITNAQYQKFISATGHREPAWWLHAEYNRPNQPVVGVSWDDAKAYCRWTNKRLPTEVEWEKAGRGGLEGLRYPWRGAINEHLANYNYAIGKPMPVGNYEPNGYRLYDVIGNVAEWCADVYDTTGFSSGRWRIVRGGSWSDDVPSLGCAVRDHEPPKLRYDFIGFRCVQSTSP